MKSSNSYSHTEDDIKKFSAKKKSSHNTRKTRKSRRSGREKTHQESRYGFDVEKRKKKGRRELDEPLREREKQQNEPTAKEKKLNKKSVEANIERSRSF